MNAFVAEFVGTMLLVLMGNGVVANVLLARTKGHGSGWIVICAGWGFAVYTAVACVGEFSGAHLNPAVTLGLATASVFDWQLVPGYMLAQMAGGIAGAVLVYVFYQSHYAVTEAAELKLATFCTAPAIRSFPQNFCCEMIATFVLVYTVLLMTEPVFDLPVRESTQHVQVGLGSLGALRVGLLVFAIGLSLGGTTGYAINPARDLGPRIAHALLPIPGKGSSDWSYSPIPVLGPLAGALLAAAGKLAMSM
jgi:glycerol uptake facilitator protein